MHLTKLEVTQVRNLQNLKILPHSQTNFIIGRNGSGKTSILEAISILSSGRSFRATDSRKVITHDMEQLVVFGESESDLGQNFFRLGISRFRDGSTLARINGETQTKISALALTLPVLSIDTSSMDLIDGGPSLRRSMLDWGMFHVEHSYLQYWQKYRQALKQKNALLKSSGTVRSSDVRFWNKVLSEHGDQIDVLRRAYIEQLDTRFKSICCDYFNISDCVELRYRPGWSQVNQQSLADILEDHVESEIERRSCLYGPHRADIQIVWDSGLAKDICSRGQKKLVLYGVRLAQVAVMKEANCASPILLLDDLPAELDKNNIEFVTRFLVDFPCQTFITAISEQSINETLLSRLVDHRMFHVEHGELVSQR